MLPTPLLPKIDFELVYEPAEDTFLFLDALQDEMEFLRSKKPLVVAEIGSGSGCLITFLAKHLATPSIFIASDINCTAVKATKATASLNCAEVNSIRTEFLASLRCKIDLLICNPPYVPTEQEEYGRRDLHAAWSGGSNGREMIDNLLLLLPNILAENGVFYLLLLKQNDPASIAKSLCDYECKFYGGKLELKLFTS